MGEMLNVIVMVMVNQADMRYSTSFKKLTKKHVKYLKKHEYEENPLKKLLKIFLFIALVFKEIHYFEVVV